MKMTSALQANSDAAQATATTLQELAPHLAAAVADEVGALATELYATGAGLLELRAALTDPRHAGRRQLVEEDKYVVLKSLEFTFRDIRRLLDDAGLPRAEPRRAGAAVAARVLRRDTCRVAWETVDAYFRGESNNSLQSRFLYYKRFLKDCTRLVVG